MNSTKEDFPQQIELFARLPNDIKLDNPGRYTPIPVDDDLSSLSAILLDDDYYEFLLAHSENENGLRRANLEALICLKAKAFLDIKERISQGEQIDSRNFKKHKGDVFRLAIMLTAENRFELPESIQGDINQFAAVMEGELPDKAIFKEMGLVNTDPKKVFELLKAAFNVK